jgi:copper chaperone CopZ
MESAEEQCTLQVEGMTCANCAMGIQKLLQNKGLDDVNVNFAVGEVRFTTNETYPIATIKKDIESLGYHVIEPETPATGAGAEDATAVPAEEAMPTEDSAKTAQ